MQDDATKKWNESLFYSFAGLRKTAFFKRTPLVSGMKSISDHL